MTKYSATGVNHWDTGNCMVLPVDTDSSHSQVADSICIIPKLPDEILTQRRNLVDIWKFPTLPEQVYISFFKFIIILYFN